MSEAEWSGDLAAILYGVALLCALVLTVALVLAQIARGRRAMMTRNETLTYARLTAGGPAWGLCEVTGTAEPGPGGPLTAPLSGRPCVWYRAVARQKTASGVSFFHTDVSAAPIVLNDGTGRITVLPDREMRGALRSVDLRRVPPAEAGPLPRGASDAEWYRYEEWILPPGEHLYACGKAVYDGTSVVMDRPYPEDRSDLSAAERDLADDHPYVLSAWSEERTTRHETRRMVLSYAVAGAATVIGLGAFAWSRHEAEKVPYRRR
ncbi:E3 ubiquitin ligase [Actinocorallia herbida]|uniref:RING-type E3 ubiquitin transferase n=1 Tax=Actinocorallia herbida TaxID=58109 RepID=A0A3N1CY43_9ACTN|nr:GIDE domain-containing protein [Actinocorallia herbida]ROO86165.1 E3 ubiquitin ligase [Actinocorallia herbida]